MVWKKGQSGNPSGRKRLPEEVRMTMASNGQKAAGRMKELLDDDEAWGKEGWLKPVEQVRLIEASLTKAYGAQRAIAVEFDDDEQPVLPPPSEEAVAFGDLLRGVYHAMRDEGEVPEFINAEPADRMRDVTPDTTASTDDTKPTSDNDIKPATTKPATTKPTTDDDDPPIDRQQRQGTRTGARTRTRRRT